jgi:hypothetical protein
MEYGFLPESRRGLFLSSGACIGGGAQLFA